MPRETAERNPLYHARYGKQEFEILGQVYAPLAGRQYIAIITPSRLSVFPGFP